MSTQVYQFDGLYVTHKVEIKQYWSWMKKDDKSKLQIVGSPAKTHHLEVSEHWLIDIDMKHETVVFHICLWL